MLLGRRDVLISAKPVTGVLTRGTMKCPAGAAPGPVPLAAIFTSVLLLSRKRRGGQSGRCDQHRDCAPLHLTPFSPSNSAVPSAAPNAAPSSEAQILTRLASGIHVWLDFNVIQQIEISIQIMVLVEGLQIAHGRSRSSRSNHAIAVAQGCSPAEQAYADSEQ